MATSDHRRWSSRSPVILIRTEQESSETATGSSTPALVCLSSGGPVRRRSSYPDVGFSSATSPVLFGLGVAERAEIRPGDDVTVEHECLGRSGCELRVRTREHDCDRRRHVVRRDDLFNVQGDLSTIDNLVADHLIARRRRILAAKYVRAIGRLRQPVRIDDQLARMTDPATDENTWVAGLLGSPR